MQNGPRCKHDPVCDEHVKDTEVYLLMKINDVKSVLINRSCPRSDLDHYFGPNLDDPRQ